MFFIRLAGEPDAERSGEHHGDLHDGDRRPLHRVGGPQLHQPQEHWPRTLVPLRTHRLPSPPQSPHCHDG